MPRSPLLPLTAIAALMLSAAAQAQETPVSAPASAAEAPAHKSYTPDQLSSFARATVELQNLGSQDPEQMTRAIQDAGMSVQDYNQMGDAMRADPRLASGLTPYLDSANTERAARIYAQRSQTPSFAGKPRAASHHAAASSRKAGRHSRSASAHKARRAHATKASHKRTKSAAHHATKKTSHKSSSTAHKTRKHKRS